MNPTMRVDAEVVRHLVALVKSDRPMYDPKESPQSLAERMARHQGKLDLLQEIVNIDHRARMGTNSTPPSVSTLT